MPRIKQCYLLLAHWAIRRNKNAIAQNELAFLFYRTLSNVHLERNRRTKDINLFLFHLGAPLLQTCPSGKPEYFIHAWRVTYIALVFIILLQKLIC